MKKINQKKMNLRKNKLKTTEEFSINDGLDCLITFDVSKANKIISMEDNLKSKYFQDCYKDISYCIKRSQENSSLQCCIVIEDASKYEDKIKQGLEKIEKDKFTSVKMIRKENSNSCIIFINSNLCSMYKNMDLRNRDSILNFETNPYRTLSFINSITFDCINLILSIKKEGC